MLLNRFFSTVLCYVALVFFYGCGDKNGATNETPLKVITPISEKVEGTLFENTATIEKSDVAKIKSFDLKSGYYLFNGKQKEIEQLKPGYVVLFEGHSLRKVKAVKNENGNTILETEFAALNEYYKNATISYKAPISWDANGVSNTRIVFGDPHIAMIRPLMPSLNSSYISNDFSIDFKDRIADWDVELKLEPQNNNKLKIELKAEKERLCSIVVEGEISSFESQAEIVIVNGTTQNFTFNNQNLEGEIEVKFAASGLGTQTTVLEIPAQIERTILVNGTIPVTLRLKANLKIYPEVAPGSTSQVSMKYKYKSGLGFQYDGSRLTSTGDIVEDVFEQTGDSNTATTGIAGMGVAVEFPRVEVGILGNIVVPYVVNNTRASSYLSTGLLDGNPCHRASCKFEVHAGVSMQFLGVGSINHDYKLGERVQRWIVPGSHCGD